jgi:multidrug efflux pump subunit AcrA (membrane-fusion protein)/YHS domain-containing protein
MKAKSSRISVVVRNGVVVVLLIAAFVAGYLVNAGLRPDHVHAGAADANKPAVVRKWYCSMDPQIIRDGPGKCPICGMALVPMPTNLSVGGAPIFTIADLSQLWVKLDAYESDMMWIRYGQLVEFTTEAYPSEVFKGKISFIEPTLDPKTRTVKLHVNVDNAEGKLKPGMFVRAVVRAKVAQSGTVMDPQMAGKWICPMHPSVIESERGTCEKCEMDLVTTESLGYVQVASPNEAPLVIPASAPLITGKRAVVYVRLPDTEKPTFEGREIVLGPRAGDYYIVESGLMEGEIVVTNGSFKIDSALQIQAKPSMMNPQGGVMPVGHDHGTAPKPVGAGDHQQHVQAQAGEQTLCPVMGLAIDKKHFITYKGKKVYFCCPGCEEKFLKEPEKFMAKLPQFEE